MTISAARESIVDALAYADESSRAARAERIEWLAGHHFHPGMVVGELAVMHMLDEACHCFVSGHFIGALLLATSFVEQSLSEELRGVVPARERGTFELMIKSGRQCLPLPKDLFDRTDRLRQLRNPFTHRKAADHPDALGTRFLASKAHPAAILEADAKLAIEVMYEWFRSTLRSA